MNPDSAEEIDDGQEAAPLGDLAEAVAERRAGTDDPLWEKLKDGSGEAVVTDAGWDDVPIDDVAVVEPDDRVGPVEGDVPGVHTVPKRKFCMQCPYFSEPPDVRCTHDGTEILEFVDADHVRVENCVQVDDDGE